MTNHIAVITGGSKGIGADLASRLLAKGYKVVSIDRLAPEQTHKDLHHVQLDLLDADAVAVAAAQIADDHQVTHFIHNAGLIWPKLVADATPQEITGLAQLHLGSALTLLQAFLPSMKSSAFGRVVFTGSRAALGVPTRTAYSASKAAMIGMARTWALELAPFGITVNVVAPGPVQTDNFWEIIEKGSDRETALANSIPVGRLGSVEDISNAMLFFCDPASGFVTGQTLYVCGGSSIGGLTL